MCWVGGTSGSALIGDLGWKAGVLFGGVEMSVFGRFAWEGGANVGERAFRGIQMRWVRRDRAWIS